MLALLLWLLLGWRAGVAEVTAELALVVIAGGGGRGRRVLGQLRLLRPRRLALGLPG
jgi:hypothetical protein